MSKWDYIILISNLSDQYGCYLIDMMNQCNKSNLQEITFVEAKEYYENLIKR